MGEAVSWSSPVRLMCQACERTHANSSLVCLGCFWPHACNLDSAAVDRAGLRGGSTPQRARRRPSSRGHTPGPAEVLDKAHARGASLWLFSRHEHKRRNATASSRSSKSIGISKDQQAHRGKYSKPIPKPRQRHETEAACRLPSCLAGSWVKL